MAKDILWFHAVIFPALLIAVERKLPKKIYAHGFFTVNGQKMSKSMGNVFRPADMVKESAFDGTRYLLIIGFSLLARTGISLELMKTAQPEFLDHVRGRKTIAHALGHFLAVHRKKSVRVYFLRQLSFHAISRAGK